MKTILMIRHAKSQLTALNNDFTKILTEKGINDAKNIASVKIEWFVNPEAGNEIQGKSATLDVVFGLEQVR